jgi:predicted acylesterase/phospholipase RssA
MWPDTLAELRARTHLFCGGGGVRCLSFLSLLELLRSDAISHFAGVSAGAVICLHAALGYSHVQTLANFEANEDIVARSLCWRRLVRGQSLVDPEPFRAFLARVLQGKGFAPDATLADVLARTRKHVEPIAFCLETSTLVKFAAHVRVVDAVLASVALPGILPFVHIDGKRYCDAGLLNASPLHLCPPDDLLALVVRLSSVDHAPAIPQTFLWRCNHHKQMSIELALSRGAAVLQVPCPPVSLLTRRGIPLSAFSEKASIFFVLYVLRAEILGLLTSMVCCRC